MFVIDVSHLEFFFENEDAKLFEDLDFTLNIGEIVGMVGPNGSGKSTLIKLLAGELSPNAGQIKVRSYGYLPQDASLGDLDRTVGGILLERFGVEPWRGDLALEIGGLSAIDKKDRLSDLSGGQRTRLGLGLILAGEVLPECLILDEPTNNLDKEGLGWLKKVLEGFRGGVIIASHERRFLDDVVQRIVAIEGKKLANYGGGYSFYRDEFSLKQKVKQEQYEATIKEKKKLETYLKRNQDFNQQVSNESYDKLKHEDRRPFGYHKWDSEVSFGKKIRATYSKIEQLGEAERPDSAPVLDVRLEAEIPSSKIVLRVDNLNKSFQLKNVLKDLSLEVRGAERVLVSGKNGSGKSTLLNIIAGKLNADSGEVIQGENLSFGYFSQDVYGIDQTKTPLEELNLLERDKARCYMLCIKAGLSKESADKKISELSRGQQAKLGFIKLMLMQPDVLLLDEPTNHLDVQTKEAIEKALEDFRGAILVASHDQYFVDNLGITKTIAL
ncbi:MAG: ATP-binding cassette, subfamily er 3 [Patescibacteria group bacterium]|nr:ATP-binding cassette, subfamily er 3 [Patescibacteria group bacterium]